MNRAEANLVKHDLPPLPAGLTPRGLRRAFASVPYAPGEAPPVALSEMWHTSPTIALKVCAQATRLGEGEQAALRALVDGEQIEPADGPLSERLGERTAQASFQPTGGRAA